MARVLAHPFRITTAGTVATIDDATDEADAQAIAVLVSTRQGERPLVPLFGVPDPVFGDLTVADVAAGLATFGPPLIVDGIDYTPISDTVETVTIRYRDPAGYAETLEGT